MLQHTHTQVLQVKWADTNRTPASGIRNTQCIGTYGTLDLEANVLYLYSKSNITNLDVDDETFTDVFTYTVSDGNGGKILQQ